MLEEEDLFQGEDEGVYSAQVSQRVGIFGTAKTARGLKMKGKDTTISKEVGEVGGKEGYLLCDVYKHIYIHTYTHIAMRKGGSSTSDIARPPAQG